MNRKKKSNNPFQDTWFYDYKCEDGSTCHMEGSMDAVQNHAVKSILELDQHARQIVIGPINPIERWNRRMEIIKKVCANQTEKTMPEDFENLNKSA